MAMLSPARNNIDNGVQGPLGIIGALDAVAAATCGPPTLACAEPPAERRSANRRTFRLSASLIHSPLPALYAQTRRVRFGLFSLIEIPRFRPKGVKLMVHRLTLIAVVSAALALPTIASGLERGGGVGTEMQGFRNQGDQMMMGGRGSGRGGGYGNYYGSGEGRSGRGGDSCWKWNGGQWVWWCR